MATPRPDFIDIRSASQASSSRALRSPRLHVAGEAPPELSPLDAFALQSRLLAKQLEESEKQGRRLSRLPPLTMESPLIVQGRSDYFRSMSVDEGDGDAPLQVLGNPGLGVRTEIDDDVSNRPRSMHPRMSTIPPTPDASTPLPLPLPLPMPRPDSLRGRLSNGLDDRNTFFDAASRREQSPKPLDSALILGRPSDAGSFVQDFVPQPSPRHVQLPARSPDRLPAKKNSFDSATGLVPPPRSSYPKRSSSIISSPLESTDEDGLSSMSASFHSHQGRKLSASSGLVSPGFYSSQRSPSICSDASGLPRPSYNFSRPMSRAGTPGPETPGLETPARQASMDSHTSFVLQDDAASTPVSMHSEGSMDLVDDGRSAAPSYIYSKFSLPRGKTLHRSSGILLDSQPQAQFQYGQPTVLPATNLQTFPISGGAPPSPPTIPGSPASSVGFKEPGVSMESDRAKLSVDARRIDRQPSPDPSRASSEAARQSEDAPRGRPLTSPLHDAFMKPKVAASTTTSDSASTIRAARSQQSNAPTMNDMSAEEHLAKAIALHESGALQQSTYHLRFAARQGHPTGMLLYALACRHGWGMRANPREGVQWLRRAADSAQIEIADDEDQAKEGKAVDVVERKTRKAQFALSIYELGVSHMNGWGIEQDKALALRCFEIAGCRLLAV